MAKIYFNKIRAILLFFMCSPIFAFGQIDLLQTTNNNITVANLACSNANKTMQNDFARLYNLPALGYNTFEVTKVSFGVHGFALGSASTYAVSVKVYASTGGTADANLMLKGQATVNITSAMVGTVVEVPLSTAALVTSPEMLIVVSAPDGTATSTGFFPGGNSNGQSAQGYIKAPGCGVSSFTSYSNVGGANQHLVLFPTGNPTALPLPVTLKKFTATAQNNSALLQWETASEQNNRGFEIWRSAEDGKFVKITDVGSQNPNASAPTAYTFTDKNPSNGSNYYKLVQIDRDGKETELGVRTLSFSLSNFSVQLYPNPTITNQITVSWAKGAVSSLKLIDFNGKILQLIQAQPSATSSTIALANYPAGTYLLRVEGDHGVEVKKVVKL